MLQRRIWVNGKHSSKLRLKNVLLFFFGVLMFLPGVVSAAIAETTLTVKLPKVPPTFKTARVSVTSVEAETANLLASVVLNTKSKKVQLKVKTVPQIIYADLSSSDGNELSAHSHVLRPVDGKKMNVTIQLEPGISEVFSEATDLSQGLSSSSADPAWPPVGIDLIGVPSSGLTVEGPGFSGVSLLLRPIDGRRAEAIFRALAPVTAMTRLEAALLPAAAGGTWNIGVPRSGFTATGPGLGTAESNGEADLTITDLVNSPCYGSGKRFVITEVEPHRLAERQTEIDLSNSPYADPSMRLVDRSVPPDKFVNGSVSSDGSTMTVSLVLVDSGDNVLASGSATGPADDWFGNHLEAVKALTDDICDDLQVQLTSASCPRQACTCCTGDECRDGIRWTEQMTGTAAGPVGTTLDTNLSTQLGGTLSCPGWTPSDCGLLPCCKRESENQPEQITFESHIELPPFGLCACPPPQGAEVGIVAQAVSANGAVEDIRNVTCPGP